MRNALKHIALGATLLVLGTGPALAQVPQSVTLTSADASGAPGDVVSVPIDAGALVGSGSLQIIKFAVEFDGTLLEPLGATPGAAISGWPAEDLSVDLLDGRVVINGLTTTPVAVGEGLLFTLDFSVKPGVLDGSTTAFDMVGSTPKDPVLLQGDPTDDTTRVKVYTTDGTFTVVGGAICAPGDALLDGETTVADAVNVLRIVAGSIAVDTPVERCNADADQDGSIDVGDAVVVLRRVVGLPVGRLVTGDAVVARLERTADGSRLVLDGAGVHGLSFAVDGDVAATLSTDAIGVTSAVDGRTRVAFASATPLGGGRVSVDLPGFGGASVADLTVVGADGGALDVRFESGVPTAGAVARLGNYPNPFNPSTTIEYALPAAGRARLELFNARGERVAVLVDGQLPAGTGTVVWNGTDANGRGVSSGVYFAQLVTDGGVARQRLVLLK